MLGSQLAEGQATGANRIAWTASRNPRATTAYRNICPKALPRRCHAYDPAGLASRTVLRESRHAQKSGIIAACDPTGTGEAEAKGSADSKLTARMQDRVEPWAGIGSASRRHRYGSVLSTARRWNTLLSAVLCRSAASDPTMELGNSIGDGSDPREEASMALMPPLDIPPLGISEREARIRFAALSARWSHFGNTSVNSTRPNRRLWSFLRKPSSLIGGAARDAGL